MTKNIIGKNVRSANNMRNKTRSFKFATIVFTTVFVITTYSYLNLKQYTWYVREVSTPCKTSDNEMNELKSLFRDTHKVFETFGLTSFLIYGSLWGALRVNDPLPWDTDFDIGLLHDEVQSIDLKTFYKEFNALNINIYYRTWLGTYRVERAGARGDVMVFKRTIFDYMCRTGIERYAFFINHLKYHMFPARLIQKPLPKKQFAGIEVSVPREGVEMQKHFYPRDWWKETKPSGCS